MIRSNANLFVHGQGLLNLTGPGDSIEAQRLVLSLFYRIYVRGFRLFVSVTFLHSITILCRCKDSWCL